jgi:hypothetical protein
MAVMKFCSAVLAASLVFGFNSIALSEDSAQAVKAASPGGFTGTVTETMNASSYTYVQVDTGKDKIWAAAPEFSVKVGDKVTIPEDGIAMKDYNSKTLKRTFDLIYFVGEIEGANQKAPAHPTANIPHADPHGSMKSASTPVDFSGIKKADGGMTVEEIYAKKSDLSGKQVRVRGKVVKFNPQIMNKNWVHIQDGTGTSGANDITVTTQDATKVGDTVLVTGQVILNQDFGQGYKYSLLLENAKLKVEQTAGTKVAPEKN